MSNPEILELLVLGIRLVKALLQQWPLKRVKHRQAYFQRTMFDKAKAVVSQMCKCMKKIRMWHLIIFRKIKEIVLRKKLPKKRGN